MSYFEENIKIIKQKNIVLYEQIQLRQGNLIDRVETAEAKDGSSYLKVRLHGEWVALNSTYAPKREAEIFSRKYAKLLPYSRVLFLGFGNGFFCRALIEGSQSQTSYGELEEGAKVKYAFYEPDGQVFLYVMHMYDLTDILQNENILIFVEGMNENQLSEWCNKNLDVINEKCFFFDSLPGYARKYNEAYMRVQSVYNKALEALHLHANTKKLLGTGSAKNNVLNLGYAMRAEKLHQFMEQYPQGLPYVIVSAGPSLKHSIQLLKEIKDKVFIMAVDSAAAFLLAQGICPDGIMCLDAVKPPALFSEAMRQIPFFVHTAFNYEALDFVKPKHVFLVSTRLDYYKLISTKCENFILELDTGSSVATFAYAFAVQLGAACVILLGQDLCVTETASHITDVVDRTDRERANIQVAGNLEPMVNTYIDFYTYLEWFQKNISEHSEVKVINATAGGAKIEGAQYMSAQEVKAYINELQGTQAYQKPAMHMCGMAERDWNHAKQLYDEIQHKLKEIKKWLRQGKQLLEKHADCGQSPTGKALFSALEKLGQIQQKLASFSEFELVEQGCLDAQDSYLQELGQTAPDTEASVKKIMDIYRQYYEFLLSQADTVDAWCEEAKKRMQDI